MNKLCIENLVNKALAIMITSHMNRTEQKKKRTKK